jgi:hypothetical protein
MSYEQLKILHSSLLTAQCSMLTAKKENYEKDFTTYISIDVHSDDICARSRLFEREFRWWKLP